MDRGSEEKIWYDNSHSSLIAQTRREFETHGKPSNATIVDHMDIQLESNSIRDDLGKLSNGPIETSSHSCIPTNPQNYD